jgi:hypothetical protein
MRKIRFWRNDVLFTFTNDLAASVVLYHGGSKWAALETRSMKQRAALQQERMSSTLSQTNHVGDTMSDPSRTVYLPMEASR